MRHLTTLISYPSNSGTTSSSPLLTNGRSDRVAPLSVSVKRPSCVALSLVAFLIATSLFHVQPNCCKTMFKHAHQSDHLRSFLNLLNHYECDILLENDLLKALFADEAVICFSIIPSRELLVAFQD
uniref:Uncharacterized protein n=1 Tax=Brugia malayi TaxID=6279 RepID=A8PKA6_BRUMA